MSISDLIVVMEAGVVQQIAKPQLVYEDPINLFVAKFLGTPPINVFSGSVRNEHLVIGDSPVLNVPGVKDQPVWVGIRPEGFVLDENGPLVCRLSGVEVMGRDISVISSHPACTNAAIRAIVDAQNLIDESKTDVRFALKASKVHIFSKETEERILFGQQ